MDRKSYTGLYKQSLIFGYQSTNFFEDRAIVIAFKKCAVAIRYIQATKKKLLKPVKIELF